MTELGSGLSLFTVSGVGGGITSYRVASTILPKSCIYQREILDHFTDDLNCGRVPW